MDNDRPALTKDFPGLATLSLTELQEHIDFHASKIVDHKKAGAVYAEEIYNRLEGSAKQAFEQAGKTHGKMTLPLQDGLVAEVDLPRTVKWDSEKLQAVAQTLPWERVAAMFKIAFSMPEAIYKGVSALDPDLRKKIDDARTETFGTPKITLVRAGG